MSGIAVVQRIGCRHNDCLDHEIDVVKLLRPGRSSIRLFGPFETAEWDGEEVNSTVDGGQLVSLTPDGRWLTYPGMPWVQSPR